MRSRLIISMWCILRMFIWIIMYTHHEQNLLEQLSSGTLPAACLFTCTCFCRIKFYLHRDEYLPPRALWQMAAFDWVVSQTDQYSLWSPNKAGTMGFDGRISGRVARLHHMVQALAVARCDSHSLPLAFISTMDRGPGGCVSNPLIHDLREQLKACLLHDVVTQLSL